MFLALGHISSGPQRELRKKLPVFLFSDFISNIYNDDVSTQPSHVELSEGRKATPAVTTAGIPNSANLTSSAGIFHECSAAR